MISWRAVRPWLDRAVAACGVVVLAPVVAALSWWIRRADGGPGWVEVTRMGRRGRPFAMYKLRTMSVGGPTGEAGGSPITVAGDVRITPIGRRLRAWRLDEAPQLLNVLKGDMALIGPRPEDPAFVDVDDLDWRCILSVRPGIIGPTQFLVAEWEASLPDADSYRNDVLPVKVAVDRWYAEGITPRVDLAVVAAAARQVLGGRHGPLRDRIAREVPEVERIPR